LPEMAAMVGFSHCSKRRIKLSRVGSAAAAGVLNSVMSAPAEKNSSLPARTMALTRGSYSAFVSSAATRCRSETTH
jgi:hypothetical protein